MVVIYKKKRAVSVEFPFQLCTIDKRVPLMRLFRLSVGWDDLKAAKAGLDSHTGLCGVAAHSEMRIYDPKITKAVYRFGHSIGAWILISPSAIQQNDYISQDYGIVFLRKDVVIGSGSDL